MGLKGAIFSRDRLWSDREVRDSIDQSEKSPQPFYINNTPFSHSVSFFNKSRGIAIVLYVFVTLSIFKVYVIIVAAN